VSAHYDESAMQEYLDDPESYAGRAQLEAHVTQCMPCRSLLEELRAFDATLASDSLWEMVEARSGEAPGAIRALADLLAAEDTDAEKLLAPVLASPTSFKRANVTSLPAMRTAGVVRKLAAESRELRERQPMHALVLADAAIAISDQLPSNRYPAPLLDDLRGSAWLERANVLRALGRYAEAIDALDIAARAYSRSPVAVFSLALVDYLRGVVYVETEHLDDALRLIRRSARIFRQFGEEERYVHAKIVEATILFDQHRVRDARDLFVSLITAAKSLGNAATLARLYANAANCELQLHELARAGEYYERALSLYEALGLETESIRTRWNVGCLRIAMGEMADGVARLRVAARDFERLGLRSDAALVTLDLAEALLASGDPAAAREAGDLCKTLVASFTDVGMTGHTLTAVAYLREAFADGRATPGLVRHVRQYLESRPDESGKAFEPPTHL